MVVLAIDLDKKQSITAISRLPPLQKTALIPLACRGLAERHREFDWFHDDAALQLCKKFEVDLLRYGGETLTRRAVIFRSNWFEQQILLFAKQTPSSRRFQVVNLASGFDTAFNRMAQQLPHDACWTDADVLAINTFKRGIFIDDSRHKIADIDLSELQLSLKSIALHEPANIVFCLEGILMYLPERTVCEIFQAIAASCPATSTCTVLFDWCSPLLNRFSTWHPGLRRAGIGKLCFDWSLKSMQQITAFDSRWVHRSSDDPIYAQCNWQTRWLASVYRLLHRGSKIYGCSVFERTTS